jgi:hypothetical protein
VQEELSKSIRAEINEIEADIEAEKQLLKKTRNVDLWIVEKRMRALRIRHELLQKNLEACTHAPFDKLI